MCAKMNWDRVRRENRVLQHGSAWIESGKVSDPPPTKSNAKKRASPIHVGPPMPGCICGKKVGFTGAHKKECPLSRSATRAAVGKSPLSELKTRIAQLERQIATHRSGTLEFKIGEKGGVAVYGLGRFAVTLYYEQWIRLLTASGARLTSGV